MTLATATAICGTCGGPEFGAGCFRCTPLGEEMRRAPVDHEVKCHPEPFSALWVGNKTHEIRRNDRNYQPGDTLSQREWDPTTQKYTGRVIRQAVTYLTKGGEWGIPADLCVMSVRTISKWGPKS